MRIAPLRPAECFATRCESASPLPGVNHGADRHAVVELDRPGLDRAVPRPCRVSQSCSNVERERVGEPLGAETRTTTFSCRVHESSVQFIEPVQTSRAVADAVLVVHQVGDRRRWRASRREGLDRLRPRLGRRRHRDRSRVGDVVDEPDADATLVRGEQRGEDERAGVALEAHVVEREIEARPRVVEERRDLAGHARRGLAAVGERRQLERQAVRRARPQRDAPLSRPASSPGTPRRLDRVDVPEGRERRD